MGAVIINFFFFKFNIKIYVYKEITKSFGIIILQFGFCKYHSLCCINTLFKDIYLDRKCIYLSRGWRKSLALLEIVNIFIIHELVMYAISTTYRCLTFDNNEMIKSCFTVHD